MSKQNNVRFFPVQTMEDLKDLDKAEILAGYRCGWDGTECPLDASRSFWHGWRNGNNDRNGKSDAAGRRLAKQYRESLSGGNA